VGGDSISPNYVQIVPSTKGPIYSTYRTSPLALFLRKVYRTHRRTQARARDFRARVSACPRRGPVEEEKRARASGVRATRRRDEWRWRDVIGGNSGRERWQVGRWWSARRQVRRGWEGAATSPTCGYRRLL
jgi:hypothetical protein